MKTSSKKARHRNSCHKVIEIITNAMGIPDTEVKPTPSGCTGEDIDMSTAAKDVLPMSFEVKTYKGRKFFYKVFDQCERNTPEGEIPTLYIKSNYEDGVFLIKENDFERLLSCVNKTKLKEEFGKDIS